MTVELDWLKRWAQYSPHAVALQCGETGRSLTYQELFMQALTLAPRLKERFHVARGDRVALLAQNELESIVLFFALQRLGAILVPINFRFTNSEVQFVLKDSEAKLLVTQFDELSKGLSVPILPFQEMVAMAQTRRDVFVNEMACEFEDICMILYTSGTTGFPKGAMISYRMLFWNSINTGLRLNLTQSEVVVTFLPLFHTGGWNVLTTPCLHRGARVIVLKKFDADLILQLCEKEKISILFGVPTTLDFMARSSLFSTVDLSSVRYVVAGGEPMPIPLIETWEARGIPVRQGYGLTEFGPNVFSLNEADSKRKAGSIGFPNFYIEAKVINDGGKECTDDEIGELILRGPMAMSGYWNNSDATKEAIRDGWLYTGDLVRRDREGFFYVVGRKKEMYISGGENVYPAEVERVIQSYPKVREVAVVGVPHPRWGESGRAFVVTEDATLKEEELRQYCLKHLAKFKVPLEFVLKNFLPKTESGKIAKHQLRDFL